LSLLGIKPQPIALPTELCISQKILILIIITARISNYAGENFVKLKDSAPRVYIYIYARPVQATIYLRSFTPPLSLGDLDRKSMTGGKWRGDFSLLLPEFLCLPGWNRNL
jgi:hypothetical protein